MMHSVFSRVLFLSGIVLAIAVFASIKTSHAASTNLIVNPSLETANGSLPANWSQGQWGSLTTAFEYPVVGHTGNAAKITVSFHTDGDAKWYFDNVPVTAGTVYDFSDWSNASVNTDVSVRFHMADGTDSYAWLGTVPGTNTWTQFYSPITVPTGVVSLTVFHVLGSNGSLMVDDYSLIEYVPVPVDPTTNRVSNPSFETAIGNTPIGWTQGQWGNLSASFDYPVTGHTGNAVKVTVNSHVDGDAKWYFKDVPVTAGSTYDFSDWSYSTADTGVTARFHFGDGTDSYVWLGTVTGTNAWTKYVATITAPTGAVSVTVFHTLGQDGVLTVDDYSLQESVPTTNLVANPSLETKSGADPASWSQGQWGSNQSVFAYPVVGHTGNAAKITMKSFVDGDAKWYFADVPVNPDKAYSFSDWSKSTVDTAVTARYGLVDGSYRYVWLGMVAGTDVWTEFKTSLAVPIGAMSLTVFHSIEQNGTLSIDDYTIEATGPASRFSTGMISFTFDDGFESVYTDALPILDAAGIKSTQSIITTGTFGDPKYMTAAQVKAMAANGHEIASHTRTHAPLATLPVSQAQDEIVGSKADLATLGITATSLMYPLGSYDDTVRSLVKDAGYTGARSSDEGYITPSSDPYRLLSMDLNTHTTFETAKAWIDTAAAEKWWVILTLHRQEKSGDDLYSNDPALLQRIVDYVKLKEVRAVTFGEGVSMLAK